MGQDGVTMGLWSNQASREGIGEWLTQDLTWMSADPPRIGAKLTKSRRARGELLGTRPVTAPSEGSPR